jgi:hypothetical protein
MCYHTIPKQPENGFDGQFSGCLHVGEIPRVCQNSLWSLPILFVRHAPSPGNKKTNDFHAVRHSIIRSTPNILIALFILNAVKASEISPVNMLIRFE